MVLCIHTQGASSGPDNRRWARRPEAANLQQLASTHIFVKYIVRPMAVA